MPHVMHTRSETAEGWTIDCAECGAARAIYKDGRAFETLAVGDVTALHSWSSTPALTLTATIDPQPRTDTPGNLFARSVIIDRAEWRHAWRPERCDATFQGHRCEMDAGHEGTVSIHGSSLDDHNARSANGKWIAWSTGQFHP